MERPRSVIYDEKARRMVEEMTMAEARHIAERKAQDRNKNRNANARTGCFRARP